MPQTIVTDDVPTIVLFPNGFKVYFRKKQLPEVLATLKGEM